MNAKVAVAARLSLYLLLSTAVGCFGSATEVEATGAGGSSAAQDSSPLTGLYRAAPGHTLAISGSSRGRLTLTVRVGVPGELHVSSQSLARGYFKHHELTVEKFIPNPFSEEPGDRLYKTGDLARYLPDGSIEVLGRIDNQVKIRGIRIELGEIEAVLGQHPAVRETVVGSPAKGARTRMGVRKLDAFLRIVRMTSSSSMASRDSDRALSPSIVSCTTSKASEMRETMA